MPPTAAERLKAKVDAIVARHGDDVDAADRDINAALDEQEVLTTGLLPMNSLLRRRILGAFVRDTERQKKERAMSRDAAAEDWRPVHVHAGGKCKITIWMTKEHLDQERS